MANLPPPPNGPGMGHGSPRIIVRNEETAPGAPVIIEHHYHVVDSSQIPNNAANSQPQGGPPQGSAAMGGGAGQSSAPLQMGASSWMRCVAPRVPQSTRLRGLSSLVSASPRARARLGAARSELRVIPQRALSQPSVSNQTMNPATFDRLSPRADAARLARAKYMHRNCLHSRTRGPLTPSPRARPTLRFCSLFFCSHLQCLGPVGFDVIAARHAGQRRRDDCHVGANEPERTARLCSWRRRPAQHG
mmetsp:Transcript_52696/g.146299  ORF Transcript_52696/g.146299 Transcript_52696/m.146299 type:complete len:247 (+) Transcript_52696:234-974(+)